MSEGKWQKLLKSTHNEPSLTATRGNEGDLLRREEIAFVIKTYLPPSWNRNGRVLALGCGDGFEIGCLERSGFQAISGLSSHPEELVREEIAQGDMHDMPFKDAAFGYVYSKETLEHSVAPYAALCEVNRVLLAGGEFLILISTGLEKAREWYHFSCFPPEYWFDLFRKASLEVDLVFLNEVQTGFLGRKTADKDFSTHIPVYDLRSEYNKVPKQELRFK